METRITPELKATALGQEAEAILRSCVHCGFCNATCPTYQLLGDELDGPRGRIYLIKQMLEGETAGEATRQHLDRCLVCRACETTCPSGVHYSRLLELGREHLEHRQPRPAPRRLLRRLLRGVLADARRLRILLPLARLFRGVLPRRLAQPARALTGARREPGAWPPPRHERTMIVLDGCVQAASHAHINTAAARVLDRLGISLRSVPGGGCCGALELHLEAAEAARARMRRNIDGWWPHVEAGAEAVVSTASACTSMLKDYAWQLRDDPRYADKAARLAAMTRDIAEVIATEDLTPLRHEAAGQAPIAFHAPCSLQHGLKLGGQVERILTARGYRLLPVADAHLCCGAAGTYSILQAELSGQLLRNKLGALEAEAPSCIATANIGCLIHLQGGTQTPVRHWIELLAPLEK